jgi:hypothetical protein
MSEVNKLIENHVFCQAPKILLDALSSSEDFLTDMFNSEESEDDEILELWLVSDSLGIELSRIGESSHQLDTCFIWGRKTSNLALEFDPTLQKIANK